MNAVRKKPANSVFQDEEKSKILQKLLQSKDPEDIQAANWLIKSMVKEVIVMFCDDYFFTSVCWFRMINAQSLKANVCRS